jgi:hypothetical protein
VNGHGTAKQVIDSFILIDSAFEDFLEIVRQIDLVTDMALIQLHQISPSYFAIVL